MRARLSGHVDEDTTFPSGDFREWYFRGDRKKQVVEHVDALKKDLGPDANVADTALRFCLSHPAVFDRDPRHAVAQARRVQHRLERPRAAARGGADAAEAARLGSEFLLLAAENTGNAQAADRHR